MAYCLETKHVYMTGILFLDTQAEEMTYDYPQCERSKQIYLQECQ
jgi:hypothetical protein